MAGELLRLEVTVERKDPRLPVFVAISGTHLTHWQLTGTTVVEGTIAGVDLGRRTLKAWGKGRDDWFVEIPAAVVRTGALTPGDRVELTLRLADSSTPEVLQDLLTQAPELQAAWAALSAAERRAASEHVRGAKRTATAQRRALAVVARLRRG